MSGHLGSILCHLLNTSPCHRHLTPKMDICLWVFFSCGALLTHSGFLIKVQLNKCSERMIDLIDPSQRLGVLSHHAPRTCLVSLWICYSSLTSCWPIKKHGRENCCRKKCALGVENKHYLPTFRGSILNGQVAAPRCDFTGGFWTKYLLLCLKWWLLLLQILSCWGSRLASTDSCIVYQHN